MKPFIAVFLLAALLAGCGQNEPATSAKPESVAERQPESNRVTLTKENLERVSIKTETAQLGSMGMTLKAAGRISANLNKTAQVTSMLEGRLSKLCFDLNASVKAGDVMAIVESPELLGRTLDLKSPLDGVVMERNATPGEWIDKSRSIYTISDLAELWAIAEVKEVDIAAIKPGQSAAFTTLAFPDETFHGTVSLVGNQVETGSRTVEVRIIVNNPDNRLKPGMFADIAITTTTLANTLAIPAGAIQTEGENQIAFVALGANQFEKRAIKPGREQSGRVQILDGIKAGENVVTEGCFILKSEMLKGQLGDE